VWTSLRLPIGAYAEQWLWTWRPWLLELTVLFPVGRLVEGIHSGLRRPSAIPDWSSPNISGITDSELTPSPATHAGSTCRNPPLDSLSAATREPGSSKVSFMATHRSHDLGGRNFRRRQDPHFALARRC
jgi:hypothetical protein